jgi:hypothetical protein
MFMAGIPIMFMQRSTGGTKVAKQLMFNPLTPELNPSAQRCLPRFF